MADSGAGGVLGLTHQGWKIKVKVPKGALSVSTALSIRVSEVVAPEVSGPVFELLPHGTQFSKSVKIKIKPPSNEVDVSLAKLGTFDEAAAVWRYLDRGAADGLEAEPGFMASEASSSESANAQEDVGAEVEGVTSHFSLFAVVNPLSCVGCPPTGPCPCDGPLPPPVSAAPVCGAACTVTGAGSGSGTWYCDTAGVVRGCRRGSGSPFNCASGGLPCTSRQGGCARSGTIRCSINTRYCSGVVTRRDEICDGQDNDCDGQIDQGIPTGAACDGTDPDTCNEGVLACSGGQMRCNDPNTTGSNGATEVCNGIDDDCDGLIDEGIPTGAACDGIDPDTCKEGVMACIGGQMKCNDPNTTGSNGATEICNGLDDDCDALIDEGIPTGPACDGTDADACNEGVMVCTNGSMQCNDPNTVNVELCNGIDDDCRASTVDGSGDPQLGVPCDGTDADACNEGVKICTGGALVCNDPNTPNPEVCDGIDNDCRGNTADGSADPLLGACDGVDEDLCQDGVLVCVAGGLICDDNETTHVEVCNGADDDCDGVPDNGLSVDADGDSHYTTGSCATPNDDFDDNDPTTYPGAPELCDGKDNDGDGNVDGDEDIDGDGFYAGPCVVEPDCDDTLVNVFPGANEWCDWTDNDCNGYVDDGACQAPHLAAEPKPASYFITPPTLVPESGLSLSVDVPATAQAPHIYLSPQSPNLIDPTTVEVDGVAVKTISEPHRGLVLPITVGAHQITISPVQSTFTAAGRPTFSMRDEVLACNIKPRGGFSLPFPFPEPSPGPHPGCPMCSWPRMMSSSAMSWANQFAQAEAIVTKVSASPDGYMYLKLGNTLLSDLNDLKGNRQAVIAPALGDLSGASTLEMFYGGEAGASFELQMVDLDATGPVGRVTFPVSGYVTESEEITITGISDDLNVTFLFAGAPITTTMSAAGRFEHQLALPVGRTTGRLCLNDLCGNSSCADIDVTRVPRFCESDYDPPYELCEGVTCGVLPYTDECGTARFVRCGPGPSAEVCNLRDDDCDGVIDNDCEIEKNADCSPEVCATDPENACEPFQPALAELDAEQPQPIAYGPTAPVGATAGTFDVTLDGAATYSLPIEAPGGRAGMAPNLSLVYSSQAGNGALGVGWSIAGLSEIRRCSRSVGMDGYARDVRLDDEDAICLDGNRLVALPDSDCPNGGVEYRTYADTFARICSYGLDLSADTGTFTVYEKSGQIAFYEERAFLHYEDSRHTIAWALSKRADRFGNEIRYSYKSSAAYNDYALIGGITLGQGLLFAELGPVYSLEKVTYTGPDPQRSINFEYDHRPDRIFGFSHGLPHLVDYRLSRVQVLGPGESVARTYNLSYETSQATGRSLVSSISECAGNGVCKPAIQFRWNNEPRSFTPIADLGALSSAPVPLRANPTFKGGEAILTLDVDRDGRTEILMPDLGGNPCSQHANCSSGCDDDECNRTSQLLRLSGAGAFTREEVARMPWRSKDLDQSDSPYLVLDLNGDSRDDVFEARRYKDEPGALPSVLIASSVQSPAFDSQEAAISGLHEAKEYWLADINGNGIQDLLFIRDGDGVLCLVEDMMLDSYYVELPVEFIRDPGQSIRGLVINPTGAGVSQLWVGVPYSEPYLHWSTIEFDYSSGELEVSVNYTGSAYGGTGIMPEQPNNLIAGDANGDGLPDLFSVYRNDEKIFATLYLNDGRKFKKTEAVFICNWHCVSNVQYSMLIDLDGDGDVEWLIPWGNWTGDIGGTGKILVVDWRREQLTGRTLAIGGEALVWNAGERRDTAPWLLPIDGDFDGVTDLYIGDRDGWRGFRGSPSGHADLIVGIWDGLNPRTNETPSVGVTYSSVTADDIYTPKTSTCSAHTDCRPGPFTVVKETSLLNGTHEPRRFSYAYEDSRFGLYGAGWLGFYERTQTDLSTNSRSISRREKIGLYDANFGVYPYRQAVTWTRDIVELSSTNSWLHDKKYDVQLVSLNDGLNFTILIGGTEETAYDNYQSDASPARKSQTKLGYDSFGNLTFSEQTTRGYFSQQLADAFFGGSTPDEIKQVNSLESYGSKLTTLWTYDHESSPSRLDDWLIGLPKTVVTTSTSNFCVALSESPAALATWRPFWADGVASCPDEGTQTQESRYTYYANGSLETTTQAPFEEYQLITHRTYDGMGNITAVASTGRSDLEDDFVSRTTTIAYDTAEHTFPRLITNSLGHTQTLIYDRVLGLPVAAIEADGNVAVTVIDGFGRPTSVARSGGDLQFVKYTSDSIVEGSTFTVETRSSTGAYSESHLDMMGRPYLSRWLGFDGELDQRKVTYDQLGREATRTAAHDHGDSTPEAYTTSYDTLGRPLSAETGDGVVSLRYGGNVVEATDGRGGKTTRVHGAGGQLLAVRDALGQVTRYDQAAFGLPWHIVDPSGGIMKAVHDAYGRRISLDDPYSGQEETLYNSFGELSVRINAVCEETRVYYDLLGRRVSQEDIDGTSRWTWDTGPGNGLGKLAAAFSSDGGHSYAYSTFGQLQNIKSSFVEAVFFVDFTYDQFGRMRRIHYPQPNGTPERFGVVYKYGKTGEVTDILRGSGQPGDCATVGHPMWTAGQRNANGSLVQEVFNGSFSTTRNYWPRSGRLKTIVGSFQHDEIHYNENGSVKTKTNHLNGITKTFEYDGLDRLTKVLEGSSQITTFDAQYDPLGNIIQRADVGTYSYEQARPKILESAGSLSVIYDQAGRMVHRWGTSISYNALDLPRRMEDTAGGLVAEYKYGPDGERIAKTNVKGTTYFVQDLYERVDQAGETTHRFHIPGPDRVVMTMEMSNVDFVPEFYNLHDDHLGSVVAISSVDRGLVARREYDPFGKLIASGGGLEGSIGYTGHRDESELDLVHMRGRVYDPMIGRFLTPDPLVASPYNPQALNRHSYVFNNPLSLVDPSGFVATTTEDPKSLPPPPPPQELPACVKGSKKCPLQFPPIYSVGNVPKPKEATPAGGATANSVKITTPATEEADDLGAGHDAHFEIVRQPYVMRKQLFGYNERLLDTNFQANAAGARLAAELAVDPAGKLIEIGLESLAPKFSSPIHQLIFSTTVGVVAVVISRNPNVVLKGGRGGKNVKNLVGPANSAVKGNPGRVFITNEKGQVILDVTKDRVKPVKPGIGFGDKDFDVSDDLLKLIDELHGGG